MDTLSGLFSKKQPKDTRIPLPPLAPLEAKADITDTWEAVERFPACLFLTDPILSDEPENYTVKDVVFTIKSNDQGWCNEDNFEGEYEGSWTWFEVAILRPIKEGVRISPRDKQSIASEPFIRKYLDEQKISTKLSFVINPEGSALWHLQRNRRGNDVPFLHTISWKQDSTESESERLGWDFDANTGAGSGVNFVRSLQKGDRVLMIARAKQSGSVNYISEATIQIHFEGFIDTLPVGSTQDLTNSGQSNTATRSNASRSDLAKAPDAPTVGERKSSISISDAKADEPSTQPDVRPPYLDVPRLSASPLPSSPTSNNAPNFPMYEQPKKPQSTGVDAESAQLKAEIQQTGVGEGGVPISSAPPAVIINTPVQPNASTLNVDVGPPVPPKTPAEPKTTGTSGNGIWKRLPGRKKKSTSTTKANIIMPVDNGTQSQSGVQADSSQPIVIVNDQAEPPVRDPATASTPLTERPKPRFGGWGDKVNLKLKRGKTSTTLANDLDKVEA